MTGQLAESVGFVVGRFQVARLTKGHRHVIRWALKLHQTIAIVVGQTGSRVGNRHNPLTFAMVEAMLQQSFPHDKQRMVILRLEDNPISHFLWARDLDNLLKNRFPDQTLIGYGGRNSFLNEYVGVGEFETVRITDVAGDSGTQHRAKIAFPHTESAREALMWYHNNRPNFMFATGDLAIHNPKTDCVLVVGKKRWGNRRAFMGGHADKLDQSARSTAMRERSEEILGITIGPLGAIDSSSVPDPRTRGSEDGYMTNFYYAEYLSGTPRPNDDIEIVEWVPADMLLERLVPWHYKLGVLLQKYISR